MKFVFFHLMPWPHLPADFETTERSAWVTYSNANYDPEQGSRLYGQYLDQMAYAEELGFDAIACNEHHQTAYGLMPSPNVIAAMLVQRTSRARIAILGNAIPLRDHPLRIAEEIAMLDVISGGRIICGFVRGIGPEYHSFGINPATSLERFREAHDLILASWTCPGPFPWRGSHYDLEYVNPWPRPLQQPHPPIWIPSQGSGETVRWAAERRYTFVLTFTPHENVVRHMARFREEARDLGYEAEPDQMGWAAPIYVGETDAQAFEEAAPHAEYLFNKGLKRPPAVFFPPGYLTEQSARQVQQAYGPLGLEHHDAARLQRDGQVIIGSAATVTERLREHVDRSGIGVLVPLLQFGSMGHEQAAGNMERFAAHVMPRLREHVSAVHAAARTGG
jgi:alkanesulfonate monooxygenase SsuD/methylene tetrahydromethanopterin reductase-like flavin-dependent oxidoreductase (luciferase family)